MEIIVPDSVYKIVSSKKHLWIETAIENQINILTKKNNQKKITKKIIYAYLHYNSITYQENWYLKQIGLLKYIYRNKKRKLVFN